MSRCLSATLGIAAILIGFTVSAKERSAVESAIMKAATDCVAAAALNNQNIVKLYQQNRMKEVTDWIVLKSDACDNPLRAMRLLHDEIYGKGTGRKFLLGDYLADLPRAVRERIKNEIEKPPLLSSAENTGAQKHFVIHNDSVMLMQIGNAIRGISTVKIYYQTPSEKMNQLVNRGDLFFDGSLQWDTHEVVGNARIYKWGCDPLEYQVKGTLSEYQVKGTLSGERNFIDTLELEGWTPTFGSGCRFEEFVWNHNSRLTFEPLDASAPLPPRDIGGLRPLGWVYAGYVTCADYDCNSLSVQVRADGVNVRTFPDGPVIGSLVNGTPLVVLQRTERWFYVAAGCNLGPTGVWSDTARVPLSRCY